MNAKTPDFIQMCEAFLWPYRLVTLGTQYSYLSQEMPDVRYTGAIFERPGVAGAVLQTSLSLIH